MLTVSGEFVSLVSLAHSNVWVEIISHKTTITSTELLSWGLPTVNVPKNFR